MERAFDARALKKQLQKDELQLPTLEAVATLVTEVVTSEQTAGEVSFSQMDIKYAHGQLKLHSENFGQMKVYYLGWKSI